MQTVGKRSNSTGFTLEYHIHVEMLVWSRTKPVLTLYIFSKDECRHFLEISVLMQKFCYPDGQMVHSHGWVAQPRQPVCLTLPSPLQSEHSERNVDVFIHLHLTVRPSQLSFRHHFGYHVLKSHLLTFLKFSVVTLKG